MKSTRVPPSCAPFSEWQRVWEFLAPLGYGAKIRYEDGFVLDPDLASGEGGEIHWDGKKLTWTPDAH
jgi:hypothetical protein